MPVNPEGPHDALLEGLDFGLGVLIADGELRRKMGKEGELDTSRKRTADFPKKQRTC